MRSIGWLMVPVAVLAAGAVALGTSGRAQAQYYYPPPPPYYYPPPPRYVPPQPYAPRPPPPDDLNILRLQVGIEGVSTGYYCYGYGYYPTTCYNWLGDANLILRGAAELNVGGPGMIILGFDFLPSLSTTPTRLFYEPTLDFGVSLRRYGSPVRTRFYLGFGLPIAENGKVGGLLRVGGGLSIRLAPQLALGGDLVWSLGGINGYFVSALGLAIGPELTF